MLRPMATEAPRTFTRRCMGSMDAPIDFRLRSSVVRCSLASYVSLTRFLTNPANHCCLVGVRRSEVRALRRTFPRRISLTRVLCLMVPPAVSPWKLTSTAAALNPVRVDASEFELIRWVAGWPSLDVYVPSWICTWTVCRLAYKRTGCAMLLLRLEGRPSIRPLRSDLAPPL
jgi:hypothetical protein